MSMGKPIPETLIRQMEEDKRKELEEDSFNNFNVEKSEHETFILETMVRIQNFFSFFVT